MALPLPDTFPATLRTWRQHRELSQLDLSLAAEISQRHLSWLETGKSQPSRSMVLRLAETLDLPLGERNRLLNAAGFAAIYRNHGLDDEALQPVHDALERILDQHLPNPSFVIDAEWNVLMTNAVAELILRELVPNAGDELELCPSGRPNLILLILDPRALRPHIVNWEEIGAGVLRRALHDVQESTHQALRARVQALAAQEQQKLEAGSAAMSPSLPIANLGLRFGDEVLNLFSVLTTFGTALDATAASLRIETFFPSDEDTSRVLSSLHSR